MAPIYIPTNSVGRFPFSPHPSQHLLFLDYYDDGHSDQYEMIPPYSFNCISLIISGVDSLFMYLLDMPMYFLKSFNHK